jgi:ketosteroid isomerase-like protein
LAAGVNRPRLSREEVRSRTESAAVTQVGQPDQRAAEAAPGNLELVKAAFDAYGRGDLEGVADFADPAVVVTQLAELPDAETFHGRRGLIEVIEAWEAAWDDVRIERLHTREVGDNVLTTVRQRARGKGSGVEVEGVFTFVFTVKAGKLVRWQMFADEAKALAVVGVGQGAPAAA